MKCEKLLIDPYVGKFLVKIGKIGEKLDFSWKGAKIWNFWNLTFSTYSYHHFECCVKIRAKWRKTLGFIAYSFFRFWPENFKSSFYVPFPNGHRFLTRVPRTMKFCQAEVNKLLQELHKRNLITADELKQLNPKHLLFLQHIKTNT